MFNIETKTIENMAITIFNVVSRFVFLILKINKKIKDETKIDKNLSLKSIFKSKKFAKNQFSINVRLYKNKILDAFISSNNYNINSISF